MLQRPDVGGQSYSEEKQRELKEYWESSENGAEMPGFKAIKLLLSPLAALMQGTSSEARGLVVSQPLLGQHHAECRQKTAQKARICQCLNPYCCSTWASPDGKGRLLCRERLLSILLTSIFRIAIVVSLSLGLKLDCMLTINAELTAENRPA